MSSRYVCIKTYLCVKDMKSLFLFQAEPKHEAEMAQIINLALEKNMDYWIGLSDIDAEDEFTWVKHGDGLTTFSAWSTSEPNGGEDQNCVAIKGENTYFWSDEDCRYS